MSATHDEAIVLRTWDYSETSQTAALFTRRHGALRGLAKGSRRARGAFSGGMEPLTLGQVGIILRPTSDLALLTEWDMQEVFWPLRQDLGSHLAGVYIAELLLRFVTDHDPHPALFESAAESLRALGPGRAPGAVLAFQWALLTETGYRPSLDEDVQAGGALPGGRTFGFDPRRGGLTRDPRAANGAQPEHGGGVVWRVRGDTVRALRAVAAGETLEEGVSPDDLLRAGRLLGAYLADLAGDELPAGAGFFAHALEAGGSGESPGAAS